ncbi:hypothetical protein [Methanobacterium sp.]|uniref:hypothetical protein n=1 Tax=Methanobacterium sp. TaxID=2164 RepID=UPI003C782DCA
MVKLKLYVNLKFEDNSWSAFIEKELELDIIPSVGDTVVDNGLDFEVKSRRFYLEGCVSLSLDQVFEMVDDRDKKEVLTRMKKSGWYYKDPSLFDLLKL